LGDLHGATQRRCFDSSCSVGEGELHGERDYDHGLQRGGGECYRGGDLLDVVAGCRFRSHHGYLLGRQQLHGGRSCHDDPDRQRACCYAWLDEPRGLERQRLGDLHGATQRRCFDSSCSVGEGELHGERDYDHGLQRGGGECYRGGDLRDVVAGCPFRSHHGYLLGRQQLHGGRSCHDDPDRQRACCYAWLDEPRGLERQRLGDLHGATQRRCFDSSCSVGEGELHGERDYDHGLRRGGGECYRGGDLLDFLAGCRFRSHHSYLLGRQQLHGGCSSYDDTDCLGARGHARSDRFAFEFHECQRAGDFHGATQRRCFDSSCSVGEGELHGERDYDHGLRRGGGECYRGGDLLDFLAGCRFRSHHSYLLGRQQLHGGCSSYDDTDCLGARGHARSDRFAFEFHECQRAGDFHGATQRRCFDSSCSVGEGELHGERDYDHGLRRGGGECYRGGDLLDFLAGCRIR